MNFHTKPPQQPAVSHAHYPPCEVKTPRDDNTSVAFSSFVETSLTTEALCYLSTSRRQASCQGKLLAVCNILC